MTLVRLDAMCFWWEHLRSGEHHDLGILCLRFSRGWEFNPTNFSSLEFPFFFGSPCFLHGVNQFQSHFDQFVGCFCFGMFGISKFCSRSSQGVLSEIWHCAFFGSLCERDHYHPSVLLLSLQCAGSDWQRCHANSRNADQYRGANSLGVVPHHMWLGTPWTIGSHWIWTTKNVKGIAISLILTCEIDEWTEWRLKKMFCVCWSISDKLHFHLSP